jgi:hypothetical protein
VTDAVVDLQCLAAAIEAGDALTEEQRILVAAALRQTLTLHQLKQGLVLPAARNDARDRLLIEVRRKFYAADRTDHDVAHELAAAWGRYAAAGWIRERDLELCPERHLGSAREFFWLMLRANPRPLSASRIRTILARLK